MKPSAKITVPEVIEKFQSYKAKPENEAWGSLHIVLDDKNVDDHSVEFCLKHAQEKGDTDGEELASILLQMSKSQRLKIGHLVN